MGVLGRRRASNLGQVVQAAEAEQARQRAIDVARIRRIRPGLTVDLTPSDWLTKTAPDFDRHIHLVVTTVHEPVDYRDGVAWVRVWGHTTGCRNRAMHGPCVDVLARVGALLDALEERTTRG